MAKRKKEKTNISHQIKVTEYHLCVHAGRSIPLSSPVKGTELELLKLYGEPKDGISCEFTLRFYSNGTRLREPKRTIRNEKTIIELEYNHNQLEYVLGMLNSDKLCNASYGATSSDDSLPEKDKNRYAAICTIVKRRENAD